jgi:hypothetical protein
MVNNFAADSRCISVFNFESGALENDSKGGIVLTNVNGAIADAVDFKQGLSSVDLERSSAQYFSVADAALPAGFPGKNGGASPVNFGIAFWFKPEATNLEEFIYYKSVNMRLGFGSSTMYFHTYLSSGVPLISVNGLLGIWCHFAFSFDGSTGYYYGRLYNANTKRDSTFDGLVRSTYVWTPNSSALLIGSNGTSSHYDGKLDELVIFNDTITLTEMQEIQEGCFPSAPPEAIPGGVVSGCVSRYKFDNALLPGFDTQGNNHLLKAYAHGGSATYGYASIKADTVNFKQGTQSALFNKTAYLGLQDADLSSDFPFKLEGVERTISIATWFKLTAITGNRTLFTKGRYYTGGDPKFYRMGFRIGLESGVLKLYIQHGTYGQTTESITLFSGLVAGRWYHFALSYDVATKAYYAELWDDTASTESTVGPAASTYTLAIIAERISIGGQDNADQCWNGQMDEFLIFKDALTATEMADIRAGTYAYLTDANCVAAYLFELEYYLGFNSRTAYNNLWVSEYPTAIDTDIRKQGSNACLVNLVSSDHTALLLPEDKLSSGFPFKTGESNNKLALAFWFNTLDIPSTTNYYKFICGKGDFYGTRAIAWSIIFYRTATENQLRLRAGYDGSGTTKFDTVLYNAIVLNQYYHFAFSYDADDNSYILRIWDDVAQAYVVDTTGTLTHTIDSAGPTTGGFCIGCTPYDGTMGPDNDWTFAGFLDDFYVFNTKKSANDLYLCRIGSVPAPTEVRQTREDISGYDRDLSDTGTDPTGNVQGKIANASYFSGSGEQLLTLNSAPDLTADAEFTVAVRVKMHASATPGSDTEWHFTIGDLEVKIGIKNGQTAGFVSATTPSLTCSTGNILTQDRWWFIVIYFDTSGLYIEVDDTDEASDAGASTGIVAPAAGIEAGLDAAGVVAFSIDELGLWVGDNALSAAQRTVLYSGNYGQRPSFA